MAQYLIEAEIIASSHGDARAAFLKVVPQAHVSTTEICGGAPGEYVYTVKGYLPAGAMVQSKEELARNRGCGVLTTIALLYIAANCFGLWWTLHAYAARL